MKKIGIFYGSSSGKTAGIAVKMLVKLGHEKADLFDVADADPSRLRQYPLLILGIPTWGIGEPQDDWAVFMDRLEQMDLSGKRAALFGLGDQESYPDTFADAVGKLYDLISTTGCEMIGAWPVEGYDYLESEAVRNGRFAGLILDEENQPEMTDQRLERWLDIILREADMQAA